MNSDLYGELLEYIKSNKYLLKRLEELIGEESLNKLSNISYEDAMDIFGYENVELVLAKIYFIIKKEQLNSSLVNILEKNIKAKNPNIAYCLRFIEKFRKEKNVNLLGIVNTIVNSKGEEQAKCAEKAALNIFVLKNPNVIEILNLIGNASDKKHAKSIMETASNKMVLRKNNSIDFIRKIAFSKSDNSNFVSRVATDEVVLEHKDALELVKVVKECTTFDNYVYSVSTATNNNVLAKEDAVEIVRMVAKASRPYFTMLISTNENVLGCDDYLDIIKKVSRYKHEYQIWKAVDVMTCKKLLNRFAHIHFVDLFEGIEDELWLDSIKWVATNDGVLERNDAYELATLVAKAKDGKRAWCAAYTICGAKPVLSSQANFKDMISLIANAKEEHQAKTIAYISRVPAFYMRNNSFELVKDIVETEDYCEILSKVRDANIPIPSSLPIPKGTDSKGALVKKINNN